MADDKGVTKTMKAVFKRFTEGRRKVPKSKDQEYEIEWLSGFTSWVTSVKLTSLGFGKLLKQVDEKIAAKATQLVRPLTQKFVEAHINDVGLEPEFASHSRIGALSGGQKVKVVLAAAMWNTPHIIILDEPTNYLDRDSLGALSKAIEKFDGGVVMITHNDEFCRHLCPERWVLEAGRLDCQGDAEWMANALKQQVAVEQVDAVDRKDVAGNKLKSKKLKGKELKKRIAAVKKKIAEGDELDSDDEDIAYEHDL